MGKLIEWYSDLKMHTFTTPSGKQWEPGRLIFAAGVLFKSDISVIFPYLNAVLEKTVYLAAPPFIRFRFERILCALHPYYLAAYPFGDRSQAEGFVERLVQFINDIDQRKTAIRPDHKAYKPISVVDFLKILPKSNCGRCGYLSCVAFAGAVRMGRAVPRQCPELKAPLKEKVVYPIYDHTGRIVDHLELEIDADQTSKTLLQQQATIQELQQRLVALEQRPPSTKPSYEPPYGLTLTAREIEVLRLMAHGATNTEISQMLDISPHTVKSHVNHIFNKLGVNDRTQAAVWATREGLI